MAQSSVTKQKIQTDALPKIGSSFEREDLERSEEKDLTQRAQRLEHRVHGEEEVEDSKAESERSLTLDFCAGRDIVGVPRKAVTGCKLDED